MLDSQIKLLEVDTHREIPAAPQNSVLRSSASLGLSGAIAVELHDLARAEMPEHFVEGHRLMVAAETEKAMPFEWKDLVFRKS